MDRIELISILKSVGPDDGNSLEHLSDADLLEAAITAVLKVNAATRTRLTEYVETAIVRMPVLPLEFKSTAWTRVARDMTVTEVNAVFLERSHVSREEILGKDLSREPNFDGSQIYAVYQEVMRTHRAVVALVSYERVYDGWTCVLVVRLPDGGVGVLSRFSRDREKLLGQTFSHDGGDVRQLTLPPLSGTPRGELVEH